METANSAIDASVPPIRFFSVWRCRSLIDRVMVVELVHAYLPVWPEMPLYRLHRPVTAIWCTDCTHGSIRVHLRSRLRPARILPSCILSIYSSDHLQLRYLTHVQQPVKLPISKSHPSASSMHPSFRAYIPDWQRHVKWSGIICCARLTTVLNHTRSERSPKRTEMNRTDSVRTDH